VTSLTADSGTSGDDLGSSTIDRLALVLGYAGLSEPAIAEGISRLAEALDAYPHTAA
jgi:DNA-binding transcriptional MocR family regulator